MKKKPVRLLLCLLLMLSVSGCARSAGAGSTLPEGGFPLYVLNHDRTAVVRETFVLQADPQDVSATVQEVADALHAVPVGKDHASPISENVVLREFRLEGGLLTLDFDVRYLDLDPSTEALTRAAIVLSFTGIDGVDSVLFLVSGTALMKNETDPVGVMHADSFVLSF